MIKRLLLILAIVPTFVFSEHIVFSEKENNQWNLVKLSLKTGKKDKLTNVLQKDYHADFSTKANTLVFDSYRDKNKRNIFTLNLTTGEIKQLTHLTTRDGHPNWSPDGKSIVFQSSRTGDSEVFIMKADGSQVTQLTQSPKFDGIPVFSPNGQAIAFNSSRGKSPHIFVMDLATGSEQQITNGDGAHYIQDWFSNHEVLVISDVTGTRQLYRLNMLTKFSTLISAKKNVRYARLNRDTNQLIFIADDNKWQTLYLSDLDGQNMQALTTNRTEKKFPGFIP